MPNWNGVTILGLILLVGLIFMVFKWAADPMNSHGLGPGFECDATRGGAVTCAKDAYIQKPQVEAVRILRDGSVQIEGRRYREATPLRAKLNEINRRNPPVELELHIGSDVPAQPSFAGLKLLVRAGYKGKVGFLVEPKT